MNSAKRLTDILKTISKEKDYYKACEVLFSCNDTYSHLYFYRYFLNDLKHIEKILKKTGKYKENIHKSKIDLVALSISPNYIEQVDYPYSISSSTDEYKREKEQRLTNLPLAIEFMELMETFIIDETLYSQDIEALRIALKDIKKTNTPLDEIITQIDEAVLYYGYFGNNIIEDKLHKVLGITCVNMDKIKLWSKQFPKAFKIIINFFDFYKKMKEIKEEIPILLDSIVKLIKNIDLIDSESIED